MTKHFYINHVPDLIAFGGSYVDPFDRLVSYPKCNEGRVDGI